MKLSSQEEYGLRCLLQLGREGPRGSLSIAELSRAEGISTSHAAKLMRILRRKGFVKSTRGQAGGYRLSRPADQIAVGHVLAALGGRIFESDFCADHSGIERLCTHMGDCSIRSVWRMVQETVDQVLGRLTLKDLLRSEQEMTVWASTYTASLPSLSHPAGG